MIMMIIIIALFCLRWEAVTSWRSPMVLQMPVLHVWVAILETEDIKLCNRMNLKPGSSMPIFWDVDSIWELEGGISAQEKREVAEGENQFQSSRDISASLFLQEGSWACQESWSTPWVARKVCVGFPNTWTPAWCCCSLAVSMVSVEADKGWFLTGSNGCSPLKEPSLMRSACSHPQTNELIKLFFCVCSGILHSPIKLLSQSSWNKSTTLLHNSF